MKVRTCLSIISFSVGQAVFAQAQSNTTPNSLALLQQSVKIACIVDARPGMLSTAWFGTDVRDRIFTVAQGAERQKDGLDAGIDALAREEDRFKTQLSRENDLPRTPASSGDINCLTSYLNLLAALDVPSRKLMQQETSEALAANEAAQLAQTAQQIQVQQELTAQANAQKVAADQLAAQQDAMRIKAANDAIAAQLEDLKEGIIAAHLLPSCDSEQTLSALKGAMFLGGLTVQTFDHSTDASSQPFGGTGAEPERFCKSHFVTNTQDGQIVFGIKWTDGAHSGIAIEFLNNP